LVKVFCGGFMVFFMPEVVRLLLTIRFVSAILYDVVREVVCAATHLRGPIAQR
jgi:hypothetical protein